MLVRPACFFKTADKADRRVPFWTRTALCSNSLHFFVTCSHTSLFSHAPLHSLGQLSFTPSVVSLPLRQWYTESISAITRWLAASVANRKHRQTKVLLRIDGIAMSLCVRWPPQSVRILVHTVARQLRVQVWRSLQPYYTGFHTRGRHTIARKVGGPTAGRHTLAG